MREGFRFSFALVAAVLVSTGAAYGGYDIPSSVFGADKVTDALEAAKAKGRPIAFIQSNASTTCGLCSNATLAFFDEFRTRAVIVHLSFEEKPLLPEFASKDFVNFTDTFGKYIPAIAFYDPSEGTRLSKLGYEAWSKDKQGSIRAVKRELSASKSSAGPAPSGLDVFSKGSSTPPEGDVDPSAARAWKDRSGRVIEARLEKVENGLCTFVTASGEKVSCPLAELSPEDQKLAGKVGATAE